MSNTELCFCRSTQVQVKMKEAHSEIWIPFKQGHIIEGSCSELFTEGEKRFSFLLPKLARLVPKGPVGWTQATTQLLNKDFQVVVHATTHTPWAQCSRRPRRSSEHIFLSSHFSLKIARISSWGRIWLLKLCHYHGNLKISLIWPQTPALWSSPNSHANLFSMNVPSCKFKRKISLHTVMEPAGMNMLSFLAAWLCPNVTNKQGPDLQDTSRYSPQGQSQFLWALELVQYVGPPRKKLGTKANI